MKLNTLTKLMKWIAVSIFICLATSLVGSPGASEATTEGGFLSSLGHQMSTAPPTSEISADGNVIKNAATDSMIKSEMDRLAITQLIAEESSILCEIQAIVSEEKRREEEGMSTNVLSKARAVIIRETVDLKEGSLASASTETGNLSGYGIFGNYSRYAAIDSPDELKGSASPGD